VDRRNLSERRDTRETICEIPDESGIGTGLSPVNGLTVRATENLNVSKGLAQLVYSPMPAREQAEAANDSRLTPSGSTVVSSEMQWVNRLIALSADRPATWRRVTKQTGFLVAIRNGVISLAVLILFINGVASAQCAGLSIYGRQEAQSQD